MREIEEFWRKSKEEDEWASKNLRWGRVVDTGKTRFRDKFTGGMKSPRMRPIRCHIYPPFKHNWYNSNVGNQVYCQYCLDCDGRRYNLDFSWEEQ